MRRIKLCVSALLCVSACLVVSSCIKLDDPPKDVNAASKNADSPLMKALTPSTTTATKEGLAAAIVIDTSGSMDRRAAKGNNIPKITYARAAANDIVAQFARYADDHKGETVLLAIYEFSARDDQERCREVVPMSPPNRDKARTAIAQLRADGGTPIGDAMIKAKLALDATGLARKHLLVVTDGENTNGYDPDEVAVAINKRPETERPSLYFVAFDVDAKIFEPVKKAGGLIMSAASGKELNDTLDMLLRGKILIEK
jgi:Ca-activated chloride channel family protein